MRSRLNFRSINFRIWIYLLIFIAVILFIIWFLQFFFLNNYYESMKITQTEKTAKQIISAYRKDDISTVVAAANKASDGEDMYIKIVREGETVYPTNETEAYNNEIEEAEMLLSEENNDRSASTIITNENTERRSYIYAEYINEKKSRIIYIISPLYPVNSTINILQKQFIYIMLISLFMAFALAIYLSSRISRPIRKTTLTAHRLADGEYGVIFPVYRDYTEIAELGETLNKMSSELERSSTMQKDLMANVSHDLRTPLTMIKSYAEMIRDLSGDDPEKRKTHLQVIIEESDRLNKLVNDMLALTAMQSGNLSLDTAPFNLHDAVENVLAPYKVYEVNEGFDIVFNCKPDIVVEGDEERIKQVVSNLLTNAIKYCGEDQKIFINIRRWGHTVHCEVVDNGVGIKPEELEHIWERHYKTSSNHVRPTSGSGLGLSIVKEILQLHGSKFGVESKVGKGTTVWFELKSAHLNEPS